MGHDKNVSVQAGGKRMKDGRHVILCVDDDKDVLDYLKIILTAAGFEFIGVTSGKKGMEEIKSSPVDLVIVDLMMEEIDAGTNLVKEARALNSTIPIYLLSSVGDEFNMSSDFSTLGLSGVFQKPIDPKMLIGLVKRTLGVS
jgi:two-component system, chemotaxis family, chemotaxis protein CheY